MLWIFSIFTCVLLMWILFYLSVRMDIYWNYLLVWDAIHVPRWKSVYQTYLSFYMDAIYLSIYLAFLCYIYLPIWWYLSYWKGGYLSYPFNYTYTLYTLLKYLINSIYLSIKADHTNLSIMADNCCIHLLRMHAKLLIYLSIKADNTILSIY